ncbi:MAG: hypothetical protein JXR63_00015 [Spirochaetales bacterium]|nr:hypothetical protein [Spirochaetales bacterium]
MNKRIILFTAFVIFLSGCLMKQESNIVGKWMKQSSDAYEVFELGEDGEFMWQKLTTVNNEEFVISERTGVYETEIYFQSGVPYPLLVLNLESGDEFTIRYVLTDTCLYLKDNKASTYFRVEEGK